MSVTLFDTHQVVKRLVAAGFSDAQAETVTDVVRDARQWDLETLATKADLALLGAELRGEMAELRSELHGDMAELRSELRGEMAELRTSLTSALAGLRMEMDGKIAAVEQRLLAALANSRHETLRWMVGLLIAQTGLILAVMRLLPAH